MRVARIGGWDSPSARALGQGQVVLITLPGPTGPVLACDAQGRPLGLAERDDTGCLRVKRLFRWAAVT